MSKTKTTQTQSSTSTPTNPEFVTRGAEGLAGNIQNLAGQDPKSFFAGPSDLQNQAFGAFAGLGAQGLGWLSNAAGMAGQQGGYNPALMTAASSGPVAQATAQDGYRNLGNYQNPFENTVVNNTMGDLDRARQLTQNQNGQGAIMSGQYGGSRQGVMDANADEGFLRSVGSTLGNLRYQGFNTAIGASGADADRSTSVSVANTLAQNQAAEAEAQRQQQAALANQGATNTASQYSGAQDMQRAQLLAQLGQYGLGGMMDAGGVQQGIAQQQAGAPLTVQQMLSGSYGSLPLGLFNGNTSTGTGTATQQGSFLDTVGKIAQIGATAAPMFSDRRLKVDVRPLGTDAKGRDWYDYRYAWDASDVTRRGVMAQEIMASDPDAVSTHESGFLMVDYSKLGH
jgi:hypothetical protein